MKFGDRNTKFFHSAAISRRKRNKIESLISNEGDTISNAQELKTMAKEYFSMLYQSEGIFSNISTTNTFPKLQNVAFGELESMFTDLEIKEAVFCMGPLKAPGPDGLQPIFFHSQWDIIGKSVCVLVRDVYANPETLVVLIPKITHSETLKQFKPISLCNVIYKIITKIIANRLKRFMPSLVAPQQCSFVPGRHSSDNIVVAQEVFHSMRSKKGKKGFLAIKVDLEKAYGRIRWEFLEDTLMKVGFGDHFRKLILKCVSTATMRILFNGEKTEIFAPSRGIRQGDPLSPYLFILCLERLSHCIFDAIDDHYWKPIVLSRGGPKISHLFFADDLLLFGEVSNAQVEVMTNCLNKFCLASGQKVNVEKTRMLVSKM